MNESALRVAFCHPDLGLGGEFWLLIAARARVWLS